MAKIIANYEIVSGTVSEVVKFVKEGLNKGWQPYGELKVIYEADIESIEYVQAMALYVEEEELNGV